MTVEMALKCGLVDGGLIQVSGIAAEKFLQGQVTCDVRRVNAYGFSPPSNVSGLGAHCNVKGRIVFTFRLFSMKGDYFLALPLNQVDCAMQSLGRYAAFSRVTLTDISRTVSSDTLGIDPVMAADVIAQAKLMQIESGIAQIYPQTREQFTPHELNYPQLEAVSFDKGCYVGQEIVARMHYLGKLKTQGRVVDLSSETPPTRGEPIFCGNGDLAGYVIDFASLTHSEYRLFVNVYTAVQNELLWIGDKSLNLRT